MDRSANTGVSWAWTRRDSIQSRDHKGADASKLNPLAGLHDSAVGYPLPDGHGSEWHRCRLSRLVSKRSSWDAILACAVFAASLAWAEPTITLQEAAARKAPEFTLLHDGRN